MNDARQHEIDRNYDFFQRNLASFLGNERGRFALLRNQGVVGFYEGPGEAYRAGLVKFRDALFSVQQVDDRPVELGSTSLAID